MIKRLHGIVHGKTIQLDEELGVADGQPVEIQVRITPAAPENPGGWQQIAGALANDPHWDAIMADIYQDRKRDMRREISA